MAFLFPSPDSFSASDKVVKSYKKGREVDDRLGSESSVVFVSSGVLGVYSSSSHGPGLLLSRLEEGDSFGVANLFFESELPTRLFVEEDALLIFIPKVVIRKRIEEDSAFASEYCTYLNRKINFLLDRLTLLSLPTAKDRVSAYMSMNNNSLEKKEEIASYLGISRSQLFRAIAALNDKAEDKS